MMVALVLGSAVLLLAAYRLYGPLLARLFRLSDIEPTPANTERDELDYAPLATGPLLSQHFSAIAAAGPIMGPILAGAMFGWLPALLWILVGSILIGGVHDFGALVASVRHKGHSIAVVVRQHMSNRSFVLFLVFVWLALVYIIVAFTDATASAFVGQLTLEDGKTVVTGPGIASSSMMYLALPLIMGLLVRFRVMSMERATIVFLPLVGLSIWLGQKIPFDLAAILQAVAPGLVGDNPDVAAHKAWDVILLIYCAIASVVPLWLLLQPRGQLGGWFLYAALAAGAIGLITGGAEIRLPPFLDWETASGKSLFPFLFITIACGACSGFHALIASGTTSKQLAKEPDSRPIGYGAMLLEAMVAIVSLCCVMMVDPRSPMAQSPPNFIYAQGIGAFLAKVRIDPQLGVAFALMAFTTFVYDTLDVCTRLGRYIVQELTGWQDARGRWLGTILTAGAPVLFVMRTAIDAKTGQPIPAWRAFWDLFGASNQLLAALTLMALTVWLWRTRRETWVWLVTGIPTVVMYVMSSWALIDIVRAKWAAGHTGDPVTWIGTVLVALAGMMLIEAIAALLRTDPVAPETAAASVGHAPA
jgi:carbon starvation protein